jgi:hypothetical protein
MGDRSYSRVSFLLLVLVITQLGCADALAINTTNFSLYTATVQAPYSLYSWVLTGNTALENFYNKFNTSGILGAGAFLLLASGKKLCVVSRVSP